MATKTLGQPRGILGCGVGRMPAVVVEKSCTVITVGAPAAPGVTVAGLNVAVARGGNPLADMVTTLLKGPPKGGTVTLTVTLPPWPTTNGVCGALTVKAVPTDSSMALEAEEANPSAPE